MRARTSTKRRLTVLLLVPLDSSSSGTGSSERAYFRVATPIVICSSTRAFIG